MNLLVYAVLGLIVTWVLYVLYIQVATRAVEGRSADLLYDTFPALKVMQGRALVYCFSPQCRPCGPMSAEVDSLAKDGAAVFKLDVTEHPALARELGIRATPTLILIEGGSVDRMLLGVKTARYMRQLITTTAR